MKRMTAVIPALFCLEGVLFLLRSSQILTLFDQLATSSTWGMIWQSYGSSLRNALPVLGISSLITAWGLWQKRRWAFRGSVALAALHFGVFPFLVPSGALLLGLLLKFKDEFAHVDPMSRVQWGEASRKKKVPVTYSAVIFIVMAAIGVGAYTLVEYSQIAGFPELPLVAVPFTILLAAIFTRVVHEAGHAAAAAMLSGFRLVNLTLGPVWLSRNLTGWHWKFVPNLGWTGALASARPMTDNNLLTNVFLYLAAGPMATLLLGTSSLVFFLSAKSAPWAWCADGFGILAMAALIDFLSEMSLMRKGHVFTDGAKLMQLWSGGLERRRLLATYALGLCETTARRPSEWRPEWLEEPTSDPHSPLYFAGCYYAYVYEVDRRNWSKAGEWINLLLGSDIENPSPARRWKAAIEGAFFEASFRNDAVRARHWLSAPRDGVAVDPVSEWRAEAAVHLAEGDLTGCSDRIVKIRSRLAEVPETGWKKFETSLIDRMEHQLKGMSTEDLQALDESIRLAGTPVAATEAGSSLRSLPESQPPFRLSVPDGSAISPLLQ